MRQQYGGFDDPDRSIELLGDERVEELPPPRRRFPAALLTVFVMAIFAGGLWFAYVEGVRRAGGAAGGSIPLIRADQRPTRVKPTDPGGLAIPNQNVGVYSEKPGGPPVERLLPPPEQPAPPPIPAPRPAPPSAAATAAPNPAPAAPAGAPAVAAEPAPAKAAAAPPPEKPAAAAPAKAAPPASPEKPAAAAPAKAAPPASPEKPAAAAPAKAAPAAAAGAAGTRVQLAAVRTPEAARQEWAHLKETNADLLGKLSAVAVRADLGDKGIFYRIQAGPFADPAEADHLCTELGRRKLGCTVVR